MIAKHIQTAMTLVERHALRQQWLLSGKCVRCFHASQLRKAEPSPAEANREPVAIKASESGPTRQKRAANISEQVQKLAKELPKSVKNGQTNTQAVDPNSTMKEQEKYPAPEVEVSTSRENASHESLRPNSYSSRSAQSSYSHAYQPRKYTKAALLEHGHNTGTIAGGNFAGVLMDRLSNVVDVGISDTERTDPGLISRLKNKEVVRFESAEQVKRLAAEIPEGFKGEVIAPEQRRRLGERLVGGYHIKPVTSPAQDVRQRSLAAIENLTRLNGTYHDDDVERILASVKKLLPTALPTSAKPKVEAVKA